MALESYHGLPFIHSLYSGNILTSFVLFVNNYA